MVILFYQRFKFLSISKAGIFLCSATSIQRPVAKEESDDQQLHLKVEENQLEDKEVDSALCHKWWSKLCIYRRKNMMEY